MSTRNEAYELWWREQTKKGDPARRHDLVRDAFEAGQAVGLSHEPSADLSKVAKLAADEWAGWDVWVIGGVKFVMLDDALAAIRRAAPPPNDAPAWPQDQPSFEQELASLINRHSVENESNTPDFILARYLNGCLDAWISAVGLRDGWWGHKTYPGQPALAKLACSSFCHPEEPCSITDSGECDVKQSQETRDVP